MGMSYSEHLLSSGSEYRRDTSRQGGVGVYVRQTIPSQRRSDLGRDDLEVCCVGVKPEKARKTILADSAESLVHTLSQTAEDENVDVSIMGDFNSDLLNPT
ncbi:hypothetical protein Bbelb_276180 [Branchiostoma belcheri]|nr:hypothetical protein Bbelb_276180 [Branchiostoma belcheri]